SPDDFVAEEQTRGRGIFRRTDFPHLAGAPVCAAPFRFSTLAVSLDRPAPAGDSACEVWEPRVCEPPSRDPQVARSEPKASEPQVARSEPKASEDQRVGAPLAGIRVVHLGVGAVV